ncbi:sulfatase [Membranihabitans maritimus]|uniref:sulfatase n=1 Tax=Membranihabitans maritimus TaxID=2904244 RepID=UPI001F363D1F|nr:sulfatase [Membranihabitans maritimus]
MQLFLNLLPLISIGAFMCNDSLAKQEQPSPNIVFIMADDLGWKDVGFMGSKYYETPNIDNLAKKGMVFTDAYACAANCAPTRAAFLSGRYSPKNGVYTVRNPDRGPDSLRKLIPIFNRKVVNNEPVLDSSEVTIAEILKEEGYATALIGKWHLGDDPHYGPKSQGFDVNVGGWHAGHPKSYFSPYSNPMLEDGPEREYLTDRLASEATQFIEKNRQNPFFLYFASYSPHRPIQAKEEDIKHFEVKEANNGQNDPVYAAMIYSLDKAVGKIVKKIEELNLDKKTLIVFYSDNGGEGGYRNDNIFWRQSGITSNEPLRGGKGMYYEGGIRVPLIFYWPEKIDTNRQCSVPVNSVDFLPTFLDVVGIQRPPTLALDGKSLVPLFKDERTFSREAIYWHFPCYLEAKKGTYRSRPVGAIRSGNYKLIEFFEDNKLELYNLEKDIGESYNLVDKMPEKVKELYQKLKDWRKSIDATVPSELNPKYYKYEERK